MRFSGHSSNRGRKCENDTMGTDASAADCSGLRSHSKNVPQPRASFTASIASATLSSLGSSPGHSHSLKSLMTR